MRFTWLLTTIILFLSCGSDTDNPVVTTGSDGDACDSGEACTGSVCLDGDDFPGGLCTSLECLDGCNGGGVCVVDPSTSRSKCLKPCADSSECRESYECRDTLGVSACHPIGPELSFDAVPLAPGTVTCLGSVSGSMDFDFNVPADAEGYAVVPLAQDGGSVVVTELNGPTVSIDFDDENQFQTVTSALLSFVSPLIVPGLPGLENQFETGEHTLTVDAETENLCFYILNSEESNANSLDINVYLAGVPGINAANAGNSATIQQMLDVVDEVYAPSGVSIDEVRFFDASEQGAIESRTEVAELIATSTAPGPSATEKLGVNVFLVGALDFPPPEDGVLGISQGIPGPPGLHGTIASGIILTGEFLAAGTLTDPTAGASFTGSVLAHEMGHYLGLFHTSETGGSSFDPISDTPECDIITDSPGACPDVSNIMFPLANPAASFLSPMQGQVLRLNPLTTP